MAVVPLSRLLKKKGPFTRILEDLLEREEAPACILAPDGALLWGAAPQDSMDQAPVEINGEPAGWVCGRRPQALAGLLAYALTQEIEKKDLGAELLERYRELNLLYHLSEVLSASPSPDAIVRAAVNEAIRIIPSETGQILLKSGPQDILEPRAAWGSPYEILPDCPLVERVMASGRAEVANAVPSDDYLCEAAGQIISVTCAPLKTETSTLGVIVLIRPGERSFTAGDLKLLNTIAQQTAPVLEVSRLHEIELEKARYERELQMARQVQESLLPRQMPAVPGWQFDQRWRPAHDVSGDFYDVIAENPDRLGLVIADITDKGLPASLFMVFVRSTLRASITRSAPPARVLAHANRVICRDSDQGLFATLFYARLDTLSGDLTFVNAGHPPALVYRRAQNDLQLLARTSLPLGVDDTARYRQEDIRLNPGDFLLLYTDGVIEAINPDRQEFGLERLREVVYRLRDCSGSALLDGLEKALAEYIRPTPIQDDVTLMVVRREG